MALFTGLTKGLLAPRLPRYFREAVLALEFWEHLKMRNNLETVRKFAHDHF